MAEEQEKEIKNDEGDDEEELLSEKALKDDLEMDEDLENLPI